MLFVERLLIQVLIVLFPMLVYHALLKKFFPNVKNKHYIIGLLSCISISLLLLFPIEMGEGKILDLRFIPWYLSFIYGNFSVGIIVTLFFVIFRIVINGIGMYSAFVVILLYLPVCYYLSKSFSKLTYRKKIIYSVLTLSSVSILLATIGTLFLPNEELTMHKMQIYIMYTLANSVTIWIMVYLEEMIRSKEMIYLELQRLDKLQVVGQMAASFAHEIRNPMTAVRGFLQLLHLSTNLSKDEKKYVQISIDELDRSHEIIKNYLLLAKEEQNSRKLELINVNKEIEYVITSIHSFAILNSINILYQPFDQPIFIKGQVSDVRQLLLNIIKNGIESSLPSGNIMISSSIQRNQAQITILDQGVGMSQEQLDRLGLPFYSTKEKGTGLGLMLCYKIVHSMDGKLQFESVQEKGTTVRITFPLHT